MKLISDLRKFRSLGWSDRGLLLEAIGWLAIARLAILAVPFRWVARWCGLETAAGAEEPQESTAPALGRIARAVAAAASRTPWESACLARALAVQTMLRRRGLTGALFLGVARGEGDVQRVEAHAWVKSGGKILTGAAGHQRYAVVSRFSWR